MWLSTHISNQYASQFRYGCWWGKIQNEWVPILCKNGQICHFCHHSYLKAQPQKIITRYTIKDYFYEKKSLDNFDNKSANIKILNDYGLRFWNCGKFLIYCLSPDLRNWTGWIIRTLIRCLFPDLRNWTSYLNL